MLLPHADLNVMMILNLTQIYKSEQFMMNIPRHWLYFALQHPDLVWLAKISPVFVQAFEFSYSPGLINVTRTVHPIPGQPTVEVFNNNKKID